MNLGAIRAAVGLYRSDHVIGTVAAVAIVVAVLAPLLLSVKETDK